MASASALTLDSLVPLTHDVEPYVLEWPVLEEDGGGVLTLVLQRRPAVSSQPFLLDFCRKSVGPSTLVVVPLAVLDNGSLSPTGVQASVLVVDFQESVVQQMRLPLEFEEINFSFDLEQPYGIPSPPDLLMKVKYWLVGDVSSGEELDGEALEEGDVPKELLQANGASDLDTPQEERKTHSSAWARSALRCRQKAHRSHSCLSSSTGAGAKSGHVFPAAGVDAASASSRATVGRDTVSVQLAPLLCSTPAYLSLLESAVESAPGNCKNAGDSCSHCGPISSWTVAISYHEASPSLGIGIREASASPIYLVRSSCSGSHGLSSSLDGVVGSGEFGGCWEWGRDSGRQGGQSFRPSCSPEGHVFQQCVESDGKTHAAYAASHRFSGGTLSQRSVRNSILGEIWRLRETQGSRGPSVPGDDNNGLHASKQVGCSKGCRSTVSVALDQACMDQGRFDLAQVLCLAEEPPASVFTHRPVSMLSRSRAFSPLADQRWITVALAYLTELDTSTAKRAEMGNVSRPGTFGGQNSDEAPKPKP